MEVKTFQEKKEMFFVLKFFVDQGYLEEPTWYQGSFRLAYRVNYFGRFWPNLTVIDIKYNDSLKSIW